VHGVEEFGILGRLHRDLREEHHVVGQRGQAAHQIEAIGADRAQGLERRLTGKFTRVSGRSLAHHNKQQEIIEVWEKDPNVQAFTDLMNRCIDKPKEQKQEVEVAGNWDELAANLMRARAVIDQKPR
jgi:hypothetical protein